jgi:integrase
MKLWRFNPKTGQEHRFPIGSLANEILSGVPEIGEMLFPSRHRDERPFNGWGKAKQSFDSAIEVSDYTLHDLRRTYSSNLARLGVPIHVTEKLLNHVSGTVSGIAAVYNRHTYWDEMCEAVAAHETHLRRLIAD